MTTMIIGDPSAGGPALHPPRRLHRGHFAFMRALIQGMDERAAWTRYLQEEGESSDQRRLRSTIVWIKDTFAAAARREHRPGTARLILLDPEHFTRRAAMELPSLEEFALAQGLEDFSEEEQIEAYLASYPQAAAKGRGGGSDGVARRGRLIARQLEALRWLERLVIHDPKPLDGVEAWLSPTLSARLRRQGILTLQDLAETINRHGARWWSRVPGIGLHKAGRLVEWLQAHAPLLQLTIGAHAVTPRGKLPEQVLRDLVAPATALRPLEKLVLPSDLDGRAGTNRAPSRAQLAMGTDREAVETWIAAKAASGNTTIARGQPQALTATQRSYRKEGERLLLWAVLERGKALSSLDGKDLMAYRDFLAAPPPAWCGPRSHPRWSPQWRPLEGPLSPSALRQAVVILHGLFAWLVRQGYLQTNPCGALLSKR
jgi:hypothetical protein